MVRPSHRPHPLAGASGEGLPIAPPGWQWRCGPKIKDMSFSCDGSGRIRSRGQLAAFLVKMKSKWGIGDFNWTPTRADLQGPAADEGEQSEDADDDNHSTDEDEAVKKEEDVVVDDEDQVGEDERRESDDNNQAPSSSVHYSRNVFRRKAAKQRKQPEVGDVPNNGEGYPMPLAAAYPPDYRVIELF